MEEANIFSLTVLVVIAVPAVSAFSAHSWYCHRLIPRAITQSVTPCTYPCLLLSRHARPHIVVQNERDGTPCMIQTGLHHGVEFGKCQSSVCIQDLPQKVLRRKKRFVCLYTIPRLLVLRKQRKKLRKQIQDLQQQLERNGLRGSDIEEPGAIGGSGVGGLGIEDSSHNFGNSFGPGHYGSIGGHVRNSRFPGPESAGPALDHHGNPRLGGGSGAGGITTRVGYLPNMSNRGGHIDAEASGTSDDISNGKVRLGGEEERAVDINPSIGADDAEYMRGRGAEYRDLRE